MCPGTLVVSMRKYAYPVLLLARTDLLVALGDGLLSIGTAHLRLVLRRLLLPEVFLGLRLFLRLVAMIITGHVSYLSYRG